MRKAGGKLMVRPIKTEQDYRDTLAEVERLWEAPAGSAEADRLDVLCTLIAAFEAHHEPIAPPDPVDAILFRMDQEGLTRKDLEPWIGSRARVSEVLNRKRPLTLSMIRRLQEGLGIAAEVLIRPSHAADSPRPPASLRARAAS